MPSPVSIAYKDDLALVTIDNPPVNALGQAVRAGLVDAIKRLANEPAVRGIILVCAGRTFAAGADITEFGKPPIAPGLQELCDCVEASPKPVLAVLHGSALGGGLELALSCHYRVIDPAGTIGFPEVTLGILPGAGGTQRLPRVAGLAVALDMIASGRRVGAEEAVESWIVDAISSGDRMEFAVSFLRERREMPIRRLGHSPYPHPDPAAIAAARQATAKRSPGQIAPQRSIDVLEASAGLTFADGLALERKTFMELVASPQATALRYIFFAERASAKIPELAQAKPRAVQRAGIIGGGTMGAGIAAATLFAGLSVTLVERDDAALAGARRNVEKILAEAIRRGKLDAPGEQQLLARLDFSTDMQALSTADLIIEAVFEDLAIKQEVFRHIDRVAKPEAILATNTSYIPIHQMAAVTSRPGSVIGLHFFSPAHIMKLVEVVVPEGALPVAVATGFAFARSLGKLPIRSGDADGFIANRVMSAYRKAADYMVEDGASPWQVDAALRGFGFAVGVYQMQDMAGLDIGWANRKRLAPNRPPEERYVSISDRLCEAGCFGRKTGAGYYRYEGNASTPNPEVDAIIEIERAAKKIVARNFTEADIQARILAAMVNEGARLLDAGIALRASDIDVAMVNGFNFPRWRGGPMHAADVLGLGHISSSLELFAREDAHFWQPAQRVAKMAAEGARFADADKS